MFLALWVIEIVPEIAGDNVPLEGGITLQFAGALFTLGLSFVTGLAHGNLSGMAKFAGAIWSIGLKDGGRAISGSRG